MSSIQPNMTRYLIILAVFAASCVRQDKNCPVRRVKPLDTVFSRERQLRTCEPVYDTVFKKDLPILRDPLEQDGNDLYVILPLN